MRKKLGARWHLLLDFVHHFYMTCHGKLLESSSQITIPRPGKTRCAIWCHFGQRYAIEMVAGGWSKGYMTPAGVIVGEYLSAQS